MHTRPFDSVLARALVSVIVLGSMAPLQAQFPCERVGLSHSRQQPNRRVSPLALSPDARFVLFQSSADNLVAGDTNLAADLFLRDRQLGTTQRVNLGATGQPSNGPTYDGALSADGRTVAFSSGDPGLVAGDTNGSVDVFVRDLALGTTERVSLSSVGAEAVGASFQVELSGDGRFVAFRSNAPLVTATAFYRVHLRDRQAGTTQIVDPVPAGAQRMGSTFYYSLSGDGRTLCFQVKVQQVSPPGVHDQIFVYDVQTGVSTQVSLGTGGAAPDRDSLWPTISRDGRHVAFMSFATNLVAGFAPDEHGALFVRDLVSGTNEHVSVSNTGVPVSHANVFPVGVSDGGRFVAFHTGGDTLVYGDTNVAGDVFRKDRLSGAMLRLDVGPLGAQIARGAAGTALTPDGRFVLAISEDANLVAGDTNGCSDAFLLDAEPPTAQVYCTALANSQGCVATIAGSGSASVTNPLPCTVSASLLINQQACYLVYSVAPSSRPFQGGTLCVERPLTLLAPLASGGSPAGIDCSGSFAQDFNQRIQSGLDPRLVPGTVVFAQVHYGDPLAPSGHGRGFTPGLAFTIGP